MTELENYGFDDRHPQYERNRLEKATRFNTLRQFFRRSDIEYRIDESSRQIIFEKNNYFKLIDLLDMIIADSMNYVMEFREFQEYIQCMKRVEAVYNVTLIQKDEEIRKLKEKLKDATEKASVS